MTFEQLRQFIEFYGWELDNKTDGGECWRRRGEFLCFWHDGPVVSDFLLSRVLDQIDRDMKDVELFLEKSS